MWCALHLCPAFVQEAGPPQRRGAPSWASQVAVASVDTSAGLDGTSVSRRLLLVLPPRHFLFAAFPPDPWPWRWRTVKLVACGRRSATVRQTLRERSPPTPRSIFCGDRRRVQVSAGRGLPRRGSVALGRGSQGATWDNHLARPLYQRRYWRGSDGNHGRRRGGGGGHAARTATRWGHAGCSCVHCFHCGPSSVTHCPRGVEWAVVAGERAWLSAVSAP